MCFICFALNEEEDDEKKESTQFFIYHCTARICGGQGGKDMLNVAYNIALHKLLVLIEIVMASTSTSRLRREKFKFVFNGNVTSINVLPCWKLTIISRNNCREFPSKRFELITFFKTQLLLLDIVNSFFLLCISRLLYILRLFTWKRYKTAWWVFAWHREM